MKARIFKTVYIEAARRVQSGPDGVRLTGHRYRIDLIAEGEVIPEIGWVVDYADIKRLFEPVRQQLDHACLSDIPGLEGDAGPAALAQWIEDRLKPFPSWFCGVHVRVEPDEPPRPRRLPADPFQELPERIAYAFFAAQSLPQLPEGHPCRNLHGHTYQVEIAAQPPNDSLIAGSEIMTQLHDSHLNALDGLEQATAERIAEWIWKRLVEKGVTPEVVAVRETPTNRCHYHGT